MQLKEFAKSIFERISRNGLSNFDDPAEVDYCRTVNLFLLAFFSACLLGLPSKLIYRDNFYSFAAFLDPILYVISYFVIRSGRLRLGAMMIVLTANFAVILSAILAGGGANIHYYCWGLMVAPLALFWHSRLTYSVFFLIPAAWFVLVQNALVPTGILGLPLPSPLFRILPMIVNVVLLGAIGYWVILNFAKRQKVLDQQLATIREQQIQITNSARYLAIAEMAGGIAHEINNPLGIIGLGVDILAMELKSENPNPAKIEETLTRTRSTVQRIAKIVLGLRNLSRESKDEGLEPALVRDIVENACGVCAEKFKNFGISLEIEIPREDLKVLCKPVQVSQVLLNLLTNSFDAIAHLPSMWIRIQVIENRNSVAIRVTDCGNGIPKEISARIMEPFFTTKKAGHGTGLGLAISKKMIEEQNGVFQLDARNQHTSFLIDLPKVGA